ncbi:MAG TPA: DUF4229 domain-containing protein [Stackebrandtia sp.]|uniref:DUF4229 domain-containing protein n=1 Tax=Stackebrandtia sp. TaxID=2023065 RepID=UPI002D735DF6|nr:DUF4229 domain-containing protein [Stackebrandtia sp.]HZE40691.1 DUF4229 domain-containing protein [Stackebrandtia sp.]
MNATGKFALARVGLFLVVGAALWPTGLHPLVIAMAALLVSFLLSFVLLRKWRVEMLNDVDSTVKRRREQKDKLRAALAGEDEDD